MQSYEEKRFVPGQKAPTPSSEEEYLVLFSIYQSNFHLECAAHD